MRFQKHRGEKVNWASKGHETQFSTKNFGFQATYCLALLQEVMQ